MGRTNYHVTGFKKNIREQYTEHEQKKWFNILSIVSY